MKNTSAQNRNCNGYFECSTFFKNHFHCIIYILYTPGKPWEKNFVKSLPHG